MRWVAGLLTVVLAVLQYRLWVGDGSLAEVWQLKREIATQEGENEALRSRNRLLEAEVVDLKQGLEVIEDRARRELGMVRHDETFFQIVDE